TEFVMPLPGDRLCPDHDNLGVREPFFQPARGGDAIHSFPQADSVSVDKGGHPAEVMDLLDLVLSEEKRLSGIPLMDGVPDSAAERCRPCEGQRFTTLYVPFADGKEFLEETGF